MVSKINFYKMVASGNDFVLIDRRKEKFVPNKKNIQAICRHKFGVGSDGVLLIEKSRKCDFRMRIFNPDGSEPKMCGNGARCSAYYFFLNSKKQAISIETGAGLLEAKRSGKGVIKIKMTDPHSFETDLQLNVNGTKYITNYINTGVPHAVIFSNDIDKLDIDDIGSKVRFHENFSPEGTNVDFVKILDKDNIQIRTYERGVENETLACGTGSVAAAVVFGNETPEINFKRVVSVHTRSGEILKVYFAFKENKFSNVWLEGKARLVYKGILN